MPQQEHSAQRKTALITGASSGIGYELAKIFARENYGLVLVARNLPKLDEIKEEIKNKYNVTVNNIQSDLSLISSAQEIYDELHNDSIVIDVLVNNAGFGLFGEFAKTDLKVEMDMLQVNVVSLVQLTKLFLKDMVQRKEGKILNVASTAAFQPGPFMSIYFATKSFVLSFSEAIAAELGGSGVSISVLCPGPTETNFAKIAGTEKTRMFKIVMDARTVAEAGFCGLMKGKRIIIPGLQNKVIPQLERFVPRSLVIKIGKKLFDKNSDN